MHVQVDEQRALHLAAAGAPQHAQRQHPVVVHAPAPAALAVRMVHPAWRGTLAHRWGHAGSKQGALLAGSLGFPQAARVVLGEEAMHCSVGWRMVPQDRLLRAPHLPG